MERVHKIPLGVKIIGGFYMIASLIYFATGAYSFYRMDLFQQIPGFNISEGIFTYFSIFMIVLGAVTFISAIGLIKLKNWARIALVVISIINVVGGILSIIEKSYLSVVNLILYLIIGVYLLFNKKCRHAFRKIKINQTD